jgi:exopolysaccharide biosynthesis polyprenyl glycosylphosphotransferase
MERHMATSTSRSGLTAAVSAEAEAGAAAATAALPLPLPLTRAEAPPRSPDQRGRVLRRLLLGADVTALCVAFLVSEFAFGSLRLADALVLLLTIPLWVLVAYAHRLYHLDSYRADYSVADEIGPILQMATVWSWGALIAFSAVRPDHLPIPRIALFWGLTVVALVAFRSAARAYARTQVWYLQNALVIGSRGQSAAIVRKVLRHPEWGINVVACIDPQGNGRFPHPAPLILELVPLLPADTHAASLIRRLDIDRVMLAPGLSDRGRGELVCELSELGVHVDLIPSWSDVVGARLQLHEMEGVPLLTLPRPSLGRWSLRLKRALDLAFGITALVLLAPLLLAFAVAIKLDSPGPVLFRQRRVGKGDRPFEVFKFRSMHVDAEARKDAVAELNFHGGMNDNGMFKIRDDPRITRVGRILRRYSVDELPQLFNILRGEMSLVGPRPLIENEDRQIEGRLRRRLDLTPGLTGLWQAHGRSEIPFEEMVNLDYLYVTNWSLWGDIKLLVRTCSAVMRGRGAY